MESSVFNPLQSLIHAQDNHTTEISPILELPQEIFEKIILNLEHMGVLNLELTNKTIVDRTERYWKQFVNTESLNFDWSMYDNLTFRERCIVSIGLNLYLKNPHPSKFKGLGKKHPFLGAFLSDNQKHRDDRSAIQRNPVTAGDFLFQGLLYVRDLSFKDDVKLIEKISTSLANAIAYHAIPTINFLYSMTSNLGLNQLIPELFFLSDFTYELHKDSRPRNLLKSRFSPQTFHAVRDRKNAYTTLLLRAQKNEEIGEFELARTQYLLSLEIGGSKDQLILTQLFHLSIKLKQVGSFKILIDQYFLLGNQKLWVLYLKADANKVLGLSRELFEDCKEIIKNDRQDDWAKKVIDWAKELMALPELRFYQHKWTRITKSPDSWQNLVGNILSQNEKLYKEPVSFSSRPYCHRDSQGNPIVYQTKPHEGSQAVPACKEGV